MIIFISVIKYISLLKNGKKRKHRKKRIYYEPQESEEQRMRIDEFPNIDELVYKKIINQVPIIDEYANQEINRVLEDIKAEIERHCEITVNNEGAMTLHDIFVIVDKYKRKISRLNMELKTYQFQLMEGGTE